MTDPQNSDHTKDPHAETLDRDKTQSSVPETSETSEALPTSRTQLKEFELRAELLGELHSRPFEHLTVPRQIIHMAFLTGVEEKRADRHRLQELCKSQGSAPPGDEANYHLMNLGPWNFRWEQHTEFTTYRWDIEESEDQIFSHRSVDQLMHNMSFLQPGPLIVATKLFLTQKTFDDGELAKLFDSSSLCVIDAEHGRAQVATDFQIDMNGFSRFLIEDYGMSSIRSGMLAQRILELETYRTMALMGLPLARKCLPLIQHGENKLADLTRKISEAETIEENHSLLEALTNLAAELEAQSAETSFRFSASSAYYEIVNQRLNAVHEKVIEGHRRFSSFFNRRLRPGIATCTTVQQRQNDLSRKLMRTAELLRTRIQFELEQQNRDLLKSMNKRAKMQLRLQQTVEGLSVAAVSYYIAGLISYIAKGLETTGLTLGLTSTLITAISIPFIILFVWWMVRRIHKKFARDDQSEPQDWKC